MPDVQNTTAPLAVTKKLAEFAARTTFDTIPDEVVDRARLAIADSIGTALAGIGEPAVALLREVTLADYREGSATVIGCARKASSPAAAMANGAAAHALDFDSISLTVSGFVSSPILFTLLAIAEEDGGVSGRSLIEAFVVGWEVEAAIARGLGVHHYDGGWHSTATLAHFGAAVGAAKLLGLDTMGIRHVIGIAASEASGLRTMVGNMLNPFHVGKAARNGVLAARLAARNFVAHDHVLETPWGFCNAFNGEGRYDLDAMIANLGEPYDLVDPGVVVKVYPCCGLIHSAIDGVLDLMEDHNLAAKDVVRIRLALHELVLKTMVNDRPQTGYEAKFSIPYCIAIALQKRCVKLSQFTDVGTQDSELLDIMARVEYGVHPDLIGYETFLEHEFTDVLLDLSDGSTLSKRIQRIDNNGSRGRPLTFDQLEDKFLECAGGYGNIEAAKQAFQLIARLEALTDISEVTACLK